MFLQVLQGVLNLLLPLLKAYIFSKTPVEEIQHFFPFARGYKSLIRTNKQSNSPSICSFSTQATQDDIIQVIMHAYISV